ncbi:hypothetical protein [Flavobacterium sedimenticola]|uniref:DUF4199 domain-containing protein n=1 Tax=Flavobacterium sedimenticola TaxID=3043286 RepID=A0ABT6XTQ3_9FLAO|nr:hypothetical protein [Flavobacterium sedimenticola]MDI9258486.1 hypothetical protein [Flavobacterium sedimenticola]
MKKLVLVGLLLCSLLSFSQQITMERGRFYWKGNQIDSRKARELFATNVKAAALYKQAKSKEAWGGFMLGLGVGLTVGDVAIGMFSAQNYPTAMTYAGVGSMAIAVPILTGRKKRYEEAVRIYNSEHPETLLGNQQSTIDLKVISNTNGFGLQIQF